MISKNTLNGITKTMKIEIKMLNHNYKYVLSAMEQLSENSMFYANETLIIMIALYLSRSPRCIS